MPYRQNSRPPRLSSPAIPSSPSAEYFLHPQALNRSRSNTPEPSSALPSPANPPQQFFSHVNNSSSSIASYHSAYSVSSQYINSNSYTSTTSSALTSPSISTFTASPSSRPPSPYNTSHCIPENSPIEPLTRPKQSLLSSIFYFGSKSSPISKPIKDKRRQSSLPTSSSYQPLSPSASEFSLKSFVSTSIINRLSVRVKLYLVGIFLFLFYVLFTTLHTDYNINGFSQLNDQLQHSTQPPEHNKSPGSQLLPTPWSVSYSPIDASGSCKSVSNQVAELNQISISGIKTVQLYSSDCGVLDALSDVPSLSVVVGLYPYEYEFEQESKEEIELTRMQKLLASLNAQIQELADWNNWNRVEMLVVGSSGVYENIYTKAELATMLQHVRRIIKGNSSDLNLELGKTGLKLSYKSLGLSHISITTSEPVQSFISTQRFKATNQKTYLSERQKISQVRAIRRGSKLNAMLTAEARNVKFWQETSQNDENVIIVDYQKIFGMGAGDQSRSFYSSWESTVHKHNQHSSTHQHSKTHTHSNSHASSQHLGISNSPLNVIFYGDLYLQTSDIPDPIATSAEQIKTDEAALSEDDLCDAIDVVGLVVQPFFNSALPASSAGSLVERDIKFARYLCSKQFIAANNHPSQLQEFNKNQEKNKKQSSENLHVRFDDHTPKAIVLQAGWPTSSELHDNEDEGANGAAVASLEAQEEAIESILAAVDPYSWEPAQVSLYAWDNEEWRDPGELGVERRFGVKRLFLK